VSFKSILKKTMFKLKSKTVITTLGLLCLALLIWFGGPLIAIAGYEPLLSTAARLVALLLIALCWGIFNLTHKMKEKKNNEEMVNNMINGDIEQENSACDDSIKKEIETLQQRMNEAHEILKNTKFGKHKGVYELPWYIMIGPPGSGKTTAIQHSGLEYPLKEKMGVDMIQGVAGTRNCDWWFTNKAVLIDTAGRYTTQDSHKKQDSRAWQGFLGLLKKHRPVRPINGIIISMGLGELLNQTKTERNLHARAIKQRLQELQNQLGMTFPVYVLFSKCDLIAGFNEFFDDLEKEDCEQIWGVTFPLHPDTEEESAVSYFNKEFHALLKNLNARINSRLRSERNPERKRVIYEFPKQLRLLQNAADDFLKEIFSPNSYEVAPMLRGVYLTSATQEGNPIDKLSSELLTSNRTHVNTANTKPIRSYFIKRLLEDVIFPEKDLATTNKYHDKQNLILKRAVVVLASILTIGFTFAWWQSYHWNSELVDNTKSSIIHYTEATSGGIKVSSDIIELTKGLTILRDLPVGFGHEPLNEDAHTWGLYQGNKLKQPAIDAYKRALNGYLSPYLTSVLLDEMTDNGENLNYLYLTLKTYLMFYQPENYAEEDIKAWFSVYFERKIMGDINQKVRDELNMHIAIMLDLGIRARDKDNNAIEQARQKLSMLSLVERAYHRLKSDYIPSNIPDFKITNILSLESLKAFTSLRGPEVNQAIPGLYTYNGFHGIFNIEKNKIVKNLVEDSWVYGGNENELDAASQKVITKQLEEKYTQDYIYYWENFLTDLTLKPFSSERQARDIINALASSESPIQSIILEVRKNVQLTKIPVSKNAQAAASVAKSASDELLRTKKARISRLLPKESLDIEIHLPGKEVEDAFADIVNIDLSKIDKSQDILRTLVRSIEKKKLASDSVYGFTNNEFEINYAQVGRDLNDQIGNIPFPVLSWYDSISMWLESKVIENKQIKQNMAKKELNTMWRKEVLAECHRAISGRYPFNSIASKEVRLKDFSKFFGYGGTLDAFFNAHLKAVVNTRKTPWRFSKDVGLNSDALIMFQRAEVIRENFFENGMKQPRVEFALKPLYLDRHISHFKLEINGQELNYRHDPIRNIQFVWPGDYSGKTRVVFTPPNGGRSVNKEFVGDWSLFRFLDSVARQRPATKKDGQLEISLNGNVAKVLLTPSSVNNPFWKRSLARFSCPSRL
jgi:type VI secretion system protein ImpL